MDPDTASPIARDPWRPLRYLWRIPLVVLLLLSGIVIGLVIMSWNANAVMRDGREPFAHRLQRAWSRSLLAIFGLRPVRIGQPLPDPVLFVLNHTSWLDIEAMHSQRAACFVAKAEISHWPLIGWMASCAGTIYHKRGNTRSLELVMQTMVERLRAGRSVAVFPEGSTSHDGAPHIFHARIFQTALDAGVPVQPVALRFARGGRRVLDEGFRDGESFARNLVRLLGAAPADLELHFLDVVPPSPNARKQMAELSRERICEALGVAPSPTIARA